MLNKKQIKKQIANLESHKDNDPGVEEGNPQG